ncbi:putative F-box/LRR-repeat protein At3g42770 [Rutidosis leptorrhynchoides]|uniref:putative F-box/LRR-repeat protein At3g42770 n=1 Tax=Rutidosis leptorrhynchoides TaxID=125765 RepID=UPI003A9950FE
MEELQRRSQSEEDDIPVDLIHRIQSLLPVKEAARTCALSKTWSDAWSTIPHLRFDQTLEFANEEKERDYIKFMDHTISKYIQKNIPIESFDLNLYNKLASLANKWIPTLAAQSCFKKLSISICYECYESDGKFILPSEIFSKQNLHTLSLRDYRLSPIETISVSRVPVINCVSLRVLELFCLNISEEIKTEKQRKTDQKQRKTEKNREKQIKNRAN